MKTGKSANSFTQEAKEELEKYTVRYKDAVEKFGKESDEVAKIVLDVLANFPTEDWIRWAEDNVHLHSKTEKSTKSECTTTFYYDRGENEPKSAIKVKYCIDSNLAFQPFDECTELLKFLEQYPIKYEIIQTLEGEEG